METVLKTVKDFLWGIVLFVAVWKIWGIWGIVVLIVFISIIVIIGVKIESNNKNGDSNNETASNNMNTEKDISNIYIKVGTETTYNNPEADKYSFSLPSDFPLEQKSVALLFQCFGRFTKDDGRVSEDEVGFIKDRMVDWGFCSETQEMLKLEFNKGRDSHSNFYQLFHKFFNSVDYATLSATEFDKDIVTAFTRLAWGDGLSEQKYTLLLYIANAFGRKNFLDAFIELLRQYEEKNRSSQDK